MAADYDFLMRVDVDSSADYERPCRRQLADLPHVQRMRSVFSFRDNKRARVVRL